MVVHDEQDEKPCLDESKSPFHSLANQFTLPIQSIGHNDLMIKKAISMIILLLIFLNDYVDGLLVNLVDESVLICFVWSINLQK